jgi:hypothetical protein
VNRSPDHLEEAFVDEVEVAVVDHESSAVELELRGEAVENGRTRDDLAASFQDAQFGIETRGAYGLKDRLDMCDREDAV